MTTFRKYTLLGSIAVLLGASAVHGVPILYLASSDGGEIMVYDGPAIDGWAGWTADGVADGIVNFNGAVGNWNVNLSTGILTGTTTEPQMSLHSTNGSTGAGSLYVVFAADWFGPSVGFLGTSVTGSVVGDGTVDYASYFDLSNSLMGTGGSLPTLSFSGSQTTALTAGGDISATDAPYSLTQFITITHNEAAVSNIDAKLWVTVPEVETFNRGPQPTQSVPEGGSTIASFMLGLVGIAAWYRRKSAR